MDTQKLGRALGYGTRHAAKTIAAVAEAATAPDPRQAPAPHQSSPRPNPTRPHPAQRPRPVPPASPTRSKGLWAPLATFSSALWLRVTGLFFGLLAFSLGAGAWRLRHVAGPAGTPEQHHHLWVFFLFALLFAYFSASSFVRATLRERRDARR